MWIADDGESFHMFYLHAPRSLGDPDLRHRNARIGHAISADLIDWVDEGEVLGPGAAGSFDDTATWTGSVIRDPDGLWRMFYTGARFLPDGGNIESIGMATSEDLATWTKSPGPIVEADSRWYELLGDSDWPELAWRDPWVFADSSGNGWHMLVTARSNSGASDERGVVGHATSVDLEHWTVMPPLSAPGAGFMHLEVPQVLEAQGSPILIFSCDTPKLSFTRRAAGQSGGIWMVHADSITGPFDIASARLLASDDVYAGRIVRDRSGADVLLAFQMHGNDGQFVGAISDPIPVSWPARSTGVHE